MRIALVTETFLPSVDGVVTRMKYTIDWLVEQGHDIVVIAPDLGVKDYRGVPILGVPAYTMPLYRSRPWGIPSPRVAEYITSFHPDIVHVWQPALVGFPAVSTCIHEKIPLITSYHTDLSSYLDYYGPIRAFRRPIVWYQRRENNLAPLTLTTSNAMRRKLEEQGVHNIAVLPRGVDLKRRDPSFASEEMRDRLTGGHPERTLLVYIGRTAAEKNLGSLIPMIRSHPEWSLAIVGDGPELEQLKEDFAGTSTVFTGFMEGEELSEAFASGDVFVFPSTTETLGLVILEAEASGVPLVAAASPATVEQLQNGENGLVYDPDDPDALTKAVERLVGDQELRARLIANGLADAHANSWDRSAAATFDGYVLSLQMYADGWRPPTRPGHFQRVGGVV